MAPIRVGLIGLSGQPPGKYEGVSWTPNAHLPYLKASPDYGIVALLNSSVDSAKAAIERYQLPSTTKAYGNPDELAADKDVDLVVCSTRVDRHFQPVRASIIAGKAVFVEWPLERNLEIAREMTALAKEHNAPTIVGLQGSFVPEAQKLKEIIDSGRIGKVISSSWVANFENGGGVESKDIQYFVDRKVGGNYVQIEVGHSLEFLDYVLGSFNKCDSLMSIGYPTVDIIDPAANNKVIKKGVPNTVPDQIKIQGTVGSSNTAVSYQWRAGKTFPGSHGGEWQIVGQKGILRLTTPFWALNMGTTGIKIDLFDTITGKVEPVEVGKDEWEGLDHIFARNIARVYEAYRKKEWYPDFQWAVKRHEFLEELWRRFDAESKD